MMNRTLLLVCGFAMMVTACSKWFDVNKTKLDGEINPCNDSSWETFWLDDSK